MSLVNLFHDLLSPADRIGDCANCGGHSRCTVVLRQFSCRENAGGDQQHALATFVHFRSLAVSLCVRHCGTLN
jgi:hypothetical protein